jgi:hypothetical protein
LHACRIFFAGRPTRTAKTKEEEMKGSTLISAGRVRRIVLTAVAAAALIVPATASAELPGQWPPLDTTEPAPVSELLGPPGAVAPSEAPSSQVTATQSKPAPPPSSDGFDLGDAGIGAAIVAGAGAILLAGAALFTGRRRRLGAFHS